MKYLIPILVTEEMLLVTSSQHLLLQVGKVVSSVFCFVMFETQTSNALSYCKGLMSLSPVWDLLSPWSINTHQLIVTVTKHLVPNELHLLSMGVVAWQRNCNSAHQTSFFLAVHDLPTGLPKGVDFIWKMHLEMSVSWKPWALKPPWHRGCKKCQN